LTQTFAPSGSTRARVDGGLVPAALEVEVGAREEVGVDLVGVVHVVGEADAVGVDFEMARAHVTQVQRPVVVVELRAPELLAHLDDAGVGQHAETDVDLLDMRSVRATGERARKLARDSGRVQFDLSPLWRAHCMKFGGCQPASESAAQRAGRRLQAVLGFTRRQESSRNRSRG
jgi:hypothetical protein